MDKTANSIKEFDLTDLKFPIITVYKHPEAYPDKYIARIFDITQPTDRVIIKGTLRELQMDIIQNAAKTFIPGDEKDGSCIVGSWI